MIGNWLCYYIKYIHIIYNRNILHLLTFKTPI